MTGNINVRISSSRTTLPLAEEIIRAISESAADGARQAYHLRLIMSELVTNAYLHGSYAYPDDFIEFQADFDRRKFSFSIINTGTFPVDMKIEPSDFPQVIEESGRGLKIVCRLCSKFEVSTLPDNKTLIKAEFDLNSQSNVDTIK